MRSEFGALWKGCSSDPLPWGEEEIRGFKESPAPPPWLLCGALLELEPVSSAGWRGHLLAGARSVDLMSASVPAWVIFAISAGCPGWQHPPDLLAWHSCAKAAFGVCCGVLDNWSPVCYFKCCSMKYWVGNVMGGRGAAQSCCSSQHAAILGAPQGRARGAPPVFLVQWWCCGKGDGSFLIPSLWLVFVMKFSVRWIYHVYSVASFRSQRVNSWWAFPRDGQKLESSCLHFFQIQCADHFLGWFSLNHESQL